MPPAKRLEPLLDSSDFEKLPPKKRTFAQWQQQRYTEPARDRRGRILSSDDSNFSSLSQASTSTEATTLSPRARADLRKDCTGLGYQFPRGRPPARGPVLPSSVAAAGPSLLRGMTTAPITSSPPTSHVSQSVIEEELDEGQEDQEDETQQLGLGESAQEETGISPERPRMVHSNGQYLPARVNRQLPDDRARRLGPSTPELVRRPLDLQRAAHPASKRSPVVSGPAGDFLAKKDVSAGVRVDRGRIDVAGDDDDTDNEGNEENQELETIDDNPFQISQANIYRLNTHLPQRPATGSAFLDHNATQALNPSRASSRRELMTAYRDAKAAGTHQLVRLVYEMELACTTLQGADPDYTLHEAYMEYIGFDELVIDGLIDGSLPLSFETEGSAEYRLQQKLRKRAIDAGHPAYYMLTILDQYGSSPTLGDIRRAITAFEAYCDDKLPIVIQVERHRDASSSKTYTGVRYFLSDMDGQFVPRKLKVCQTFARNLNRQLQDGFFESALETSPFPDYFVYFGITGRLLGRFADHVRGDVSNTNYVMQLFRTCLNMTAQDGRYELRQYVVGLCGQPQRAALGEIMVTRLGQGYLTSGTGFAHYPAGRGIAISLSAKQWSEHWDWMYQHLSIEANHLKSINQLERPSVQFSRGKPVEKMVLDAIEWVRSNVEQNFMEGEVKELAAGRE